MIGWWRVVQRQTNVRMVLDHAKKLKESEQAAADDEEDGGGGGGGDASLETTAASTQAEVDGSEFEQAVVRLDDF
jgi:hypothetical protein